MAASVPVPEYHANLRAEVCTAVGPEPHVEMHRAEIAKVRRCRCGATAGPLQAG